MYACKSLGWADGLQEPGANAGARCQAPGHDSGAYLLVQPCDRDRRPNGTVIGIGPVLTDDDAAAVAEWLLGGSFDVTRLEPRLRISSRLPR